MESSIGELLTCLEGGTAHLANLHLVINYTTVISIILVCYSESAKDMSPWTIKLSPPLTEIHIHLSHPPRDSGTNPQVERGLSVQELSVLMTFPANIQSQICGER